MLTLGISYGYHDSAIALVKDGELIFASEEERFSRKKHDSSFPIRAIKACLKYLDITIEDIDNIVYYEKPLLKLNRIMKSYEVLGKTDNEFKSYVTNSIKQGRIGIKRVISEKLNYNEEKIKMVEHHQSHAATAFFPSSFEEAIVLTIDGVGEEESITLSHGKGNKLNKLKNINHPNSLGLLYSAFTAYLGFEVNEGEYKVMGMSPYGKPIYKEMILDQIVFDEIFGFKIKEDWFNFHTTEKSLYTDILIEQFGKPRKVDSLFDPNNMDKQIKEESIYYANIAASIQCALEDCILKLIKQAKKIVKTNNVCIAGGVGLNCVANALVMKKLNLNLYVHPSPGDGGTSLGAALYYQHMIKKIPNIVPIIKSNFGLPIDDEEAVKYAKKSLLEYKVCKNEDELIDKVSDILANNKVIGWMNGKSEWGPRALGFRSILAAPLTDQMRDKINESVKYRELFRPFAPSAAIEYAYDFFDIPKKIERTSPFNFMLATVDVKKPKLIPAVTHVDGSARVQTVSKENNPLYHKLLLKFGEKTGIPILLNTSFNLKGEPIVEHPRDGLLTFLLSDIEVLVMGKVIIWK